MDVAFPLIYPIKGVLIQLAPGMPPDYWWVTCIVLILLALTALVDAFTETIPDSLILLGLVAVTGMQGLFTSWPVAGEHLGRAVSAGALIWLINFSWYKVFDRDALGMGDAKWTMLAVACFGLHLAFYAWGLGAVFACVFIVGSRLIKYEVTQVTFAPFLFAGLVIGLYGIRFMSWTTDASFLAKPQ